MRGVLVQEGELAYELPRSELDLAARELHLDGALFDHEKAGPGPVVLHENVAALRLEFSGAVEHAFESILRQAREERDVAQLLEPLDGVWAGHGDISQHPVISGNTSSHGALASLAFEQDFAEVSELDTEELVETLAGFSLFGDLSRAELEGIAHTFDEEWFGESQRIVRQGFSGTGFYVILEGEAAVNVDGEQRAKLSRGDFFGELSILLDEPPVADIVALTTLRCLVLPRSELRDWLLSLPLVSLRMLQAELRRLRNANRWRS